MAPGGGRDRSRRAEKRAGGRRLRRARRAAPTQYVTGYGSFDAVPSCLEIRSVLPTLTGQQLIEKHTEQLGATLDTGL